MQAKWGTTAIAALAVLGLVGCVETRSSLTGSADRLEHSANALARDAAETPTGSEYSTTYSRDARQLADDAHAFRHIAEDRDARDADVRIAFKRVSQSYHLLRDDVERTESRELHADLRPVTDAYLDVERQMGGYPERRASADRY
jgi:hypothetical protein